MPNERRYSNELNLESVGINLPYNMQAEQSVLGAVLLKPDTLTDLVEIENRRCGNEIKMQPPGAEKDGKE